MKMFKKMGFTSRLIIVFSLLLVLVLVTIIFIDTRSTTKSMTEEIERSMLSITKENALMIDLNLLNQVEMVAKTMKASVLSRFDMSKKNSIDYILNEYEPNNYKFAEELLNTVPFADGLSVFFHESLFNEEVKFIPKLYVVNIDNKAQRSLDNWDLSYLKEEWYDKPFSTNKEFWTNPFEFNDKKMFSYALPIEINNKKFASIAMDLQFDPINEIIEKIEFFDGIGYGYMVDKDFNVIAHKTQKSLIGKNLIDINQQIFNPMIELMNKSNTGLYRYLHDGSMRIGTWSKLKNGYYLILAGNLDQVLAPVKSAMWNSIYIGLAMLIISGIVVFVLVKIMIKPLIIAEKFVSSSIENKDISYSIDSKSQHEAGKIINSIGNFFSMLRILFNSVLDSSEENKKKANLFSEISSTINNDVEETLKSVDVIADKTNDLAASIAESAASAKEVSMGSQNVSTTIIDNAQTTEQIAKEMLESKNKIIEFVKKIDKTTESEKIVQKTFHELNEVIKKINDFVSIILTISGDTNLLALNAAIEAARAGEAGKGFAVVADEVRKLADESKKSAVEISATVETLINAKDEANKAQLEVSTMIQALKDESGSILKSIISSEKGVQTISGNMESIAAISEEQTAAAEEIASISENLENAGNAITSSITSIQKRITEISTSVRNLANESFQMNKAAIELENNVKQLKF